MTTQQPSAGYVTADAIFALKPPCKTWQSRERIVRLVGDGLLYLGGDDAMQSLLSLKRSEARWLLARLLTRYHRSDWLVAAAQRARVYVGTACENHTAARKALDEARERCNGEPKSINDIACDLSDLNVADCTARNAGFAFQIALRSSKRIESARHAYADPDATARAIAFADQAWRAATFSHLDPDGTANDDAEHRKACEHAVSLLLGSGYPKGTVYKPLVPFVSVVPDGTDETSAPEK